jgi:hypothetical protein
MPSYIYIIQDFDYSNTNVYKIGRTTQTSDCRIIDRLKQYSSGSTIYAIINVNDRYVSEIESKIKTSFKNIFKLVNGYEWFEGDVEKMIAKIYEIVSGYKLFSSEPIDEKDEFNLALLEFEQLVGIKNVTALTRVSLKNAYKDLDIRLLQCAVKWLRTNPDWLFVESVESQSIGFLKRCYTEVSRDFDNTIILLEGTTFVWAKHFPK